MRIPFLPLRPAAALLALAVVSLGPVPAAAASSSSTSPAAATERARTEVLRGRPSDGRTTVVPRVDRSGRSLSGVSALAESRLDAAQLAAAPPGTPLSVWAVTYDAAFEANAPAKEAFQRAVDTWAASVVSSQTITVDAKMFTFTDPTQLGGAGPGNVHRLTNGVWYPTALANSLVDNDLDPGFADIDATFSDAADTFYYGSNPAGIATAQCTIPPETTPSAGSCYDFESVVLHELGHGLGFIGTPEVDAGDPLTLADDRVYYGVDYPSIQDPYVFDIFTETADGRAVLSYPNHSLELTAALTGNAVYWNGAHGASADRGRKPALFAEAPFLSGSSFSHLSNTGYPSGDPNGLMTPYAEQGDATRDPGEVMLGMFRDMGWVTPGLAGSLFTPLTPTRVLDTGADLVGNGQHRDLLLAGRFGVPSDATAVVLNVTAALPASQSVVRAFPVSRTATGPIPGVSNLNTAKGDNRANLVTAPISTGGPANGSRAGRVRLLNSGGSTRLVADLAGYYSPAAATYFHPLPRPVRLLDTRNATGAPRARVGQGGVLDLAVTGGSVPSSATAVALTVTAVTPSTDTYVSVYPTGTAQTTSNVNLKRGTVAANAVVVQVPTTGLSAGMVRFRNNAGTIDLVADVAGYYDTNPSGGTVYRPTLPIRLLDTRPSVLGPGATRDIVVADDFYGVPAAATASIVNLTGVDASVPTFLTSYPTGAALPNASNVNLAAGQTAASLAFVKLGTGGRIRVRNAAGAVALVVDLSGWFGPV